MPKPDGGYLGPSHGQANLIPFESRQTFSASQLYLTSSFLFKRTNILKKPAKLKTLDQKIQEAVMIDTE